MPFVPQMFVCTILLLLTVALELRRWHIFVWTEVLSGFMKLRLVVSKVSEAVRHGHDGSTRLLPLQVNVD